ncbi:tRNA epoxyqueuosine(34) reductase QueG [Chlorobaculum sp. 24CR]|uniref:tRNA epoxyqueuosine(34) reductase QueG n=1 Tax=Chlorobaculum sp. 24CR TaxID=2508878 RepID=UPI00100BDF21|nr:tRNA epoxyqueuosine(34) reductase QueG [Chlorobaculum sp. 24CR]RXK88605.1 tRNA epoxyqueuosine(34) reductase QueG [Chlorobaculum sp. 24CR]
MSETRPTIKEAIRQKALDLGFCAAGFAAAGPLAGAIEEYRAMIDEGRHGEMGYLETGLEVRANPELLLAGVKSVLSVALPWPAPAKPGAISGYAVIPDYHRIVGELLNELLDFIRLICDHPVNGRVCVDSLPVLETGWAEAAGIGCTGKNSLVIVPGHGSRIFLGELLLDLELDPDQPLDWNPCGDCTACLDACPTGALAAPGKLDARRCISYLTIELKREFTDEEAAMPEGWLYGCDHCLDACPHNANKVTAFPGFEQKEELATLSAEKALELTNSQFRKLFAETPALRLGLRRLKRNAKAVLGKTNKP